MNWPRLFTNWRNGSDRRAARLARIERSAAPGRGLPRRVIGWLSRGPPHSTRRPHRHSAPRRSSHPPRLFLIPRQARHRTISEPSRAHLAAEGPIRVPVARLDELTDLASELIGQGRFWLSQAESMKTFAATVQSCRNRLLGSLDRLHDAGLWQKGGRSAAPINPETDIPAQLRRLEEQADDLAVLAASAQAAAARWPTAAIPWSGSRSRSGTPFSR